MQKVGWGWNLTPFSSLAQPEREALRDLINRANQVRPRIFPGDRIRPGALDADYADCQVLSLAEPLTPSGCLFLRIEGSRVWLLLLAVAPERQGEGLAALFLDRAEEFARDHGLVQLKLQAVGERLAQYYLRNGFQVELKEIRPAGQWGAAEPFELWTLVRSVEKRF